MIGINEIKLLAIIFCFINTLYTRKLIINKKDIMLLRLGMLFTVLADYFLILTTKHVTGLIFFCIVQIIYNFRYMGIKKLYIQVIFGIIIFIISYLNTNADLVISIGLMYAILFLFSLHSSFLAYKKYPKPNNIFIILGMIFFALCDINVALYGLSIYNGLDITHINYNIIYALIWIFYIPSQILLSISGRKY